MRERFARSILALGERRFHALEKAHVAIVGLGAVGSFAAEALARSGIGSLRLIDIDVIQRSNINRQLYALESTLGQPKVLAARERLLDINPELSVETFQAFLDAESASDLLPDSLDYVIDAIDAVGPKIELLADCHSRGVPVISSMGAAFKVHYEKIRICDISETKLCPLARAIRRGLHRRNIYTGIPVVFSEEPGPPFASPETEEEPAFQTVTHRGRPRRTLGSLCSSTGIFGLLAAHHVIFQLISRIDG